MLQSCNGDALGGEPLDAVSRIDLYLRLYACIGMSSYACDTARARMSPPRMQSAAMNSSSNARHFPRECTLLPSSSRAFPTFFCLSSRTSYRAAIFFSSPSFVFCSFLASCLSTHVKCLVKCSAKSLPNISSFSFLFLVQCSLFYLLLLKFHVLQHGI